MIELVILTSLKITFAYEAMKEGMILHPLQRFFIWLLSLLPLTVEQYLSKPLFSCIFCMASLWGMLFTTQYFSFTWQYLTLLFAIAGMNYIIGAFIGFVHWLMEEEN